MTAARGNRGLVQSGPRGLARSVLTILVISTVALGSRLAALPGAREANLPPDAAHILNVARCFSRGQGFSNMAAWPSWMRPDRLPMPETFKEPAYPYLISAMTRPGGNSFRTGQWVSLAAGLLVPLLVYALGRAIDPDPTVGTIAGLLAAGSPVLVTQSVMVMVESLFTAAVTAMFLVACWRAKIQSARRTVVLDLAVGAGLGFAFLVRAQVLLALPALIVLLLARRSWKSGLLGLTLALATAAVVALPLLLRNLRLFGAPLHSDVPSMGALPYMDRLVVLNGADRPPDPIGYAFAHVPQVLHYMLQSLVSFAVFTLPRDLLGNPIWMPALAAGVLVSLARWRSWGFAYLYVGGTILFISGVQWNTYYFTSITPLLCLMAAIGAAWVVRQVGQSRLTGPILGRHVLSATVALTLAVQAVSTRNDIKKSRFGEIDAARHEAPWLRGMLGPGEAVMVLTTSYWAWFTDRPVVSLLISDKAHFVETVRRLKVRYAALPTHRLGEYAAHYPEGRLPAALVFHHQDPAHDVTVFEVRDTVAAGPR